MKPALVKIALLGPESTGKSTLAEALARHFNTLWVPEFARNYLPTLTHQYTKEDVWYCIEQQRNMERDAIQSATAHVVFFDTEMINLSVWLDYRYGEAPLWITDDIKQRYDFYLLTAPDIPFEPDPLREHPDLREYFFERYRQAIMAAAIPYQIIEGTGTARLQNAIAAVEKVLQNEIQ